jgi:peptidyl-prolyl cis-trans isomerase SurA
MTVFMDTKIKMKSMIIIKNVVLIILYVASITSSMFSWAEAIALDEVVAVAEHDAIMRSDLNKRIVEAKAQLSQRNAPIPPDDVLTTQILETLIIESLQMQLAEKMGVRVDDDALNEQMIKIAEQNKMTLNQFSEALSQTGSSYPEVREQVRREMTIQQLRQRSVAQRIRISDQEVDRALSGKNKQESSEYHLAAIIIKPSANTPEAIKQAQETAGDIYKEAKSGRNFAQLAAAHSTAPNAKSGGDLGWQKTSQLSSNVAQAVAGLSTNGITPPFQDGQSISIIKVLDKRGGTASENTRSTQVMEVHARHILISPSKIRSSDEAEKLIGQIKEQITQGADFAKLAEKYSDDTSSASGGGDLGWSKPEKFVPEFASAVEKMPLKKVSNPFKTKYGWHIVEVLERKNQNNAATEVKEDARKTIRKQKYEDELKMWLRQIRQESFVDIKLK